MSQEKKSNRPSELFRDPRLDPAQRICPMYDAMSIKMFRMAKPGEMGFRVVDNFAEEHMM